MDLVLSGNFDDDIKKLDTVLRVNESFDLIKREMSIAQTKIVMYYIDGFVKAEMMQKLMVHFVSLKDFGDGSEGAAHKFARESIPSVEVDVTPSIDSIVLGVLSGCSAFLCEGFGKNAIIIDARTYPARNTEEPENDRVMRGSRDGFVETMIFNTAMIRRRIRDPKFTVKYINAGNETRTDMALCYMADRADLNYVKELSDKLSNLNTDSLIMGHSSVAESLIRKGWYNPFP